MENIGIITCPSELGAGTRGASLGPQALCINAAEQNYPLFEKYRTTTVPTGQVYPYHAHTKSLSYINEFVELYEQIHKHFKKQLETYDKQLIFTGDHSSAAAFAGTLKDVHPDDHLGIIWIDAHGDLHTPYTTPSGNLHGMPVANLLGYNNEENKVGDDPDSAVIEGWEKLKRLGKGRITPKITPRDIFFVDIRDLEKEEWDLVRQHKIDHTTPQFRKEQGLERVIEMVKNFAARFDHLYISFDVDSLDESLVKGTGTPVPDGLSLEEARLLLQEFWVLPNTKALEVTEINPLRDNENQVARYVNQLLNSLDGLNFGTAY